jgi:hypothetical protein
MIWTGSKWYFCFEIADVLGRLFLWLWIKWTGGKVILAKRAKKMDEKWIARKERTGRQTENLTQN